MASPTPAVAHHRAVVASLSRARRPDDPALIAARTNLRAATLEAHIERTLAQFPPLTNEQLDRIAALLRPFMGGGAA